MQAVEEGIVVSYVQASLAEAEEGANAVIDHALAEHGKVDILGGLRLQGNATSQIADL